MVLSLPGDIWDYLETFLVVTAGEGKVVPPASSAQRPGMLLNILQYTVRHPQQRTITHDKELSGPKCQ